VAKPTKLVFPDDFRPDFQGFGPEAFKFLRGIKRSNERGWFLPRKELYETELKFQMECLVAEFGGERADPKLPVRGDPRKSQFRIYRDVRFSKNKSPYKTHIGAILSRSGARNDPGVVYIHIEPGNCRVSAGFWRSDPPMLAAWRNRMAADPDEWLDIVSDYADPEGEVYMRSISQLKTLPRGFKEQSQSPIADYLKWKSFLLARNLPDELVAGRGIIDIIRDHARKAIPLLRYGWEILDAPELADPRRHMR
jgi:uncharacterized protein (TIGR02453 family)